MAWYREIWVLCNILFTIQLAAYGSATIGPPPFVPTTTSPTPPTYCSVDDSNPWEHKITCWRITGTFPTILPGGDDPYSLTCYDCSLENISYNSFPTDFSNINIESFNVTRSGIENIGPHLFDALPQCKVLDMSHNRLTRISTALAGSDLKIDTFDLGYNLITELSADVFLRLPQLLTLSLNDNRIKDLHYDTFKGLESLLYLELQNNDICSLPLGIFRGMPNLKELNLSDNKLASLPLGTFSGLISLTELRLARNALRYFKGTELLPLHRITEIDISGNKIVHLEPYNVFANGPTLNRIHLEGNMFTCRRLIETVQFFKLKRIDVVTEHGRYDVQNIDGVPCTETEMANITASEFLENIVKETRQVSRVC